MVSVTAQKYGGLSAHPMGRDKGMAIRGEGVSGMSEGITTASLRAA